MPRITKEDLSKLVQDPSGSNRADTADKISREFSTEGLSDSERVLAEDIFRLMIRDAEVRVRKALARTWPKHRLCRTMSQRPLRATLMKLHYRFLNFRSSE